MIQTLRNIRRSIHGLFRSEKGAASVEFVVVFPFFVSLFLSAYDVAIMNMRAVVLERAVDMTVRGVRLSSGASLDYDEILEDVCDRAFLIPDCMNVTKIELTPIDTTTWAGVQNNPVCVKRDEEIQPVVTFENGLENELMLIQVCAVVDPAFPGIGVGRTMPKDSSGGYRIIAKSAFVNEPN